MIGTFPVPNLTRDMCKILHDGGPSQILHAGHMFSCVRAHLVPSFGFSKRTILTGSWFPWLVTLARLSG